MFWAVGCSDRVRWSVVRGRRHISRATAYAYGLRVLRSNSILICFQPSNDLGRQLSVAQSRDEAVASASLSESRLIVDDLAQKKNAPRLSLTFPG